MERANYAATNEHPMYLWLNWLRNKCKANGEEKHILSLLGSLPDFTNYNMFPFNLSVYVFIFRMLKETFMSTN